MSILESLHSSSDVKKLSYKDKIKLTEEIRDKILTVCSENGGHLSSNLGIVETIVALYSVFDFPKDKLVFDVGHQCYAHKLLSQGMEKFSTIRTEGGISGFPDRAESEYDAFGAGHAGTSIAATLGLCRARDNTDGDEYVIDIVGDGAFVNGLNLEALSASDVKPKKYIIILNDNGMSISKNRNGVYTFISKRSTKKGYLKTKNAFKKVLGESFITKFLRKVRGFIKRVFNKINFLEQFGFKYVGVVNGNNLKDMITILQGVKNVSDNKAVFLHIKTVKGKGVKRAEERSDLYHGVGKSLSCGSGSFSDALGEKLNSVIDSDKRVVAITAGMKDGTGLSTVEKTHPQNFVDVGIAEEFAVTYAAGMAAGGMKPFVCIYSTFLQRSYDEILHDVCLQNLPVIFCIDRAGLVGSDGKTHQGIFDISYLSHLPNMTILAPASVPDLNNAIDYALSLNSPVAIRYPKDCKRDNASSIPYFTSLWQEIKSGESLYIVAVGSDMLSLAEKFAEDKKSVGIISARGIKPLDYNMIEKIKDKPIITLEENALDGGFGSMLLEALSKDGSVYSKIVSLGVDDKFIKHGSVEYQRELCGLTIDGIETAVSKLNFDIKTL